MMITGNHKNVTIVLTKMYSPNQCWGVRLFI